MHNHAPLHFTWLIVSALAAAAGYAVGYLRCIERVRRVNRFKSGAAKYGSMAIHDERELN